MSQMRNSPVSFTATEALAIYRRVKLTSGSGTAVEYADAGEACIGVTVSAAAITEQVLVSLIKDGCTHKVECSAGVAVGASLYGTNEGKVDDAGTGATIGIALEAGSGSGSVIEALLDQDSAVGLAHIADAAAETQAALTLTSMTGTANTSPAAETNIDTLTGALTGTLDNSLADVAGSWDATSIATINKNFKEMQAELATQRALNTVIINDLKTAMTQLNAARADNVALNAKQAAILARLEAAGINLAA